MSDPSTTTRRPAREFNPRGLALTIAAAAALNLVIFGIGSAADATWAANGQTITWFLVIVASVIPVVIGWTITFLLARSWAKASTFMAWVGLVLGVVTMPAPLTATDNSATGWALASMHLATGIVWFAAVRPRRARATS